MRRRKFITLLASAAAWPLASRAQQPERMRRIGVFMSPAEGDIERERLLTAFRDALQNLGWREGHNVSFIYRWAAGRNDLIEAYAKELVALAPDLILTQSAQLVAAVRHQTRTLPILFGAASDPVELGLVESLARPGGNVTGFMSIQAESNVKYLELIKEIDPRTARVLVLMSSKDPSNPARYRAVQAGAPTLKVEAQSAEISTRSDIERAIDTFAARPSGALLLLPNPVMATYRATIIEMALQRRLPTIFPFRYLAEEGGLAAYGADQFDQFRRAASYGDRILKGEKPGDLPVQAPTKFELVINLKTAKALGLDIPATVLARADEVIE